MQVCVSPWEISKTLVDGLTEAFNHLHISSPKRRNNGSNPQRLKESRRWRRNKMRKLSSHMPQVTWLFDNAANNFTPRKYDACQTQREAMTERSKDQPSSLFVEQEIRGKKNKKEHDEVYKNDEETGQHKHRKRLYVSWILGFLCV